MRNVHDEEEFALEEVEALEDKTTFLTRLALESLQKEKSLPPVTFKGVEYSSVSKNVRFFIEKVNLNAMIVFSQKGLFVRVFFKGKALTVKGEHFPHWGELQTILLKTPKTRLHFLGIQT